ncbi:hypothetical protein Godav_001323 [Gossypium davidsonii]|uniref:EF-hand domain-containing protein n=2 Tax=Gossypium TaxID=3633 RepID=A0A7J8T2P2_GOSDV|nr:hypothetical protein [Gossypium davidsonii]MBA0668407.1 hypothetical protein [Gossypium klotzschianum]
MSFPLSPKSLRFSFHPSLYIPIDSANILTPPVSANIFHMAKPSASASANPSSGFEDFLPIMANKLGGEGLIGELCNGFNLLMDSEKGVITFDSLKKNSALLGLQDLSDDDLRCMVKEGDFDGDGALNQMEFCVLMFRLSPELMEASGFFLEEALQHDFKDFI